MLVVGRRHRRHRIARAPPFAHGRAREGGSSHLSPLPMHGASALPTHARPSTMPAPTLRHLLRSVAPAAGIVLLASCMAAPLALADTPIEFTTRPAANPIDLGLPAVKLGVTDAKIGIKVDAADKRALAAAKSASDLRAKADEQTRIGTVSTTRIQAIQEALDEAKGNEEALRAEIEQRLVDQYQQGETGDLAFLISGGGLTGLVERSRALRAQSSRDAQLAEDYTYSVARLEELKAVLDDVREIAVERADTYQQRADRYDDALVAAHTAHVDRAASKAPLEDEAATDPATGKAKAGGTWYVMDGAFAAQLYLPMPVSRYSGGTRTPARRAVPSQIQRVLSDPRIELSPSGIADVRSFQIDGRILDAMLLAANRFGRLKITALKSDHGSYTTSGNVSEHSFGCAMDIGTIGSTYITPSAQTAGGEVEQAVLFFNGLGAFQPDLAPHQVISLFDLGGATLSMSDHGDHIHVGYAC